MAEQPEKADAQVRLSIVLLGFVLSIAAGGLFSYIAEDTIPARYVLQLTSFFLVETPFIAFYAFLSRKYGWKWFIPLSAAGLAASFAPFLPGFSVTPFILLKIILMGLIIGRQTWFSQSFFERMTAAVTPGLVLALVFGGLILYRGISPVETEQIRAETLAVYSAFMQGDDAGNAVDNAMGFFQVLFKISIAFITIFSVIECWIAFMLSNLLFARFREIRETLPPFNRFKIPFHFIWMFLASGLLTVIEVPGVTPFMTNILAAMGGLYCFQGLAIATYHLNRVSRGPLLKILFWVIFFITITVTGVVLILVGIIDNWYNLRMLPTVPGGKREGIIDESNS